MSEISPVDLYEDRKAFFNEQAETWLDTLYRDPETGEFTLHKDKFERLFSLVPIQAGDHVLDVGCGSGILVPYLLKRVGKGGVVYELDYAEKMIAENQRLHSDGRLRFFVSDATKVPLGEKTCAVVICFAAFPHFDDKEAATRSMAFVLKEKGYLAIAHFESSQDIERLHRESGTPVKDDRLPSKEDMYGLFNAAGLEVLRFIDESGFYFVLGRKNSGK
jgi:demethylmenaquinone methyltransferase/2-methoxy-6-polyprenyl-1,4-benzoquinol methylase